MKYHQDMNSTNNVSFNIRPAINWSIRFLPHSLFHVQKNLITIKKRPNLPHQDGLRSRLVHEHWIEEVPMMRAKMIQL